MMTEEATIGPEKSPTNVSLDTLHIQNGGVFDLVANHYEVEFNFNTRRHTVSCRYTTVLRPGCSGCIVWLCGH